MLQAKCKRGVQFADEEAGPQSAHTYGKRLTGILPRWLCLQSPSEAETKGPRMKVVAREMDPKEFYNLRGLREGGLHGKRGARHLVLLLLAWNSFLPCSSDSACEGGAADSPEFCPSPRTAGTLPLSHSEALLALPSC